MKKKPFWIPILASIGTASILYLIGYLLKIEFFKWFQFKESSTGFVFAGSLNPIIIGFIVGFIAEFIWKFKQKGKSNLV